MLSLEKFSIEHENQAIAEEAALAPGISSIQWPPIEDVNFLFTKKIFI
jgi:hypothetical protein